MTSILLAISLIFALISASIHLYGLKVVFPTCWTWQERQRGYDKIATFRSVSALFALVPFLMVPGFNPVLATWWYVGAMFSLAALVHRLTIAIWYKRDQDPVYSRLVPDPWGRDSHAISNPELNKTRHWSLMDWPQHMIIGIAIGVNLLTLCFITLHVNTHSWGDVMVAFGGIILMITIIVVGNNWLDKIREKNLLKLIAQPHLC